MAPSHIECVAQCPKRRHGVREMVENARTHNLVERHLQLADTIDRQLMDLEIGQVVLAPEILCVPHARRAEVDSDNPRRRTARGVFRRLRCSAAGDENRARFRVRLLRPEKVKVCAASVLVLPAPLIIVEIVDRPRIRKPFVEVFNSGRHVMAGSRFRLPAVGRLWCQSAVSLYLPLVLAAVSFSST